MRSLTTSIFLLLWVSQIFLSNSLVYCSGENGHSGYEFFGHTHCEGVDQHATDVSCDTHVNESEHSHCEDEAIAFEMLYLATRTLKRLNADLATDIKMNEPISIELFYNVRGLSILTKGPPTTALSLLIKRTSVFLV